MGYIAQNTVQYKTFVKRALVEALLDGFANHPDPTVARAKIAIDYTEDDFKLPAIIVKFYESRLTNAGVGHFEWLPYPLDADPNLPDTLFLEYQHRMYKGDIEFEIFGLSSADRDVLADGLIDLLTMVEVSDAGRRFIGRFYDSLQSTPYGLWHFPTLNLDVVTGYGEQTQPPPWAPEDDLVYQTAYRVPIFGEFYSYTPPQATGTGMVEEVDVYPQAVNPYGQAIDPPAPPPGDPAYHKFKGEPPGEQDI